MGKRGGDGGYARRPEPVGPCRSLAENGARVPKVLPAAELEGVLTGLIVAMPPETVGGAAVGDDVEEAQELAVMIAVRDVYF